MSSNAMQASPGAYQSLFYKSQRKLLHEWAKAEGYSDYQYFDMVVKVEELVRKDDAFAHMVEEWIQCNIDYHVYDKLFGSKYGPCKFPRPTCREARETNPSQQGNERGGLSQRESGGNTSRGERGGSGYQSQSMNTNMSSPMTQPGFGDFGQQGSSYSIPTSQGMGVEQQAYGAYRFPQATRGYGAPTVTQGQAVPLPSTAQQVGNVAQNQEERARNQLVKNYPGRRGPLRQGGNGGGEPGGHPDRGGLANTDRQGLNQPPNNMLANMRSSEKDKAEHSNKAPAGAPTGPRGAQRSGLSQRNGTQINQPPREGRVRALQAIKKEEEKIVEKVADPNTVGATLAPMNVDRGAEDSSEEESFVIHKVHEETLVPDSTGKMVPVAELLRRAELRGAKKPMKEAKRKQAAEAVEQSHDVRDMLPKVEAFEGSNQRKRLKISPTNKDEEEEGKGAAVSAAAASTSV